MNCSLSLWHRWKIQMWNTQGK